MEPKIRKNFFDVKQAPPIKVLVVDGGGLRGVMPTAILKELEEQIQEEAEDPNLRLGHVFDMIFGTSTGGLIALGLGKLDMSCQQIYDMYEEVAGTVFPKKWTPFWNYASKLGYKTRFETQDLEKIFKDKFDETATMIEEGDKSKEWKKEPFVAVMSVMANNYLMPIPVMIRNYDIDIDKGFSIFDDEFDYHLPGLSRCKVWEAARATTAAPTYFKPINIEMPEKLRCKVMRMKICELIFGVNVNYQDLNESQRKSIDEVVNDTNNAWKQFEKDQKHKSEHSSTGEEHVKPIVDELNRNKLNETKTISMDEFIEKIFSFKYSLKLRDGGVNNNAPCLSAFVEAARLFPNNDIKMLSVGTSKGFVKEVYDRPKTPLFYVEQIFEEMFRGKELTTMFPLISLAYRDELELDLTRMNPEFNQCETEMSDATKMGDWRKAGEHYAKKEKESIQKWAKFLVEEHKKGNREKIVESFEKYQQCRRKLKSKL